MFISVSQDLLLMEQQTQFCGYNDHVHALLSLVYTVIRLNISSVTNCGLVYVV